MNYKKLIQVALFALIVVFIMGVTSTKPNEMPMRTPLVGGAIWAEEASDGTGAGYVFSFGNGDVGTYIQMPFDIWVTHMTIAAETSCTGTANVYIDTNGVNVSRSVVQISNSTTSAIKTFDPPIPIPAGTLVMFDRTNTCSSGGNGMIPALFYVAKTESLEGIYHE